MNHLVFGAGLVGRYLGGSLIDAGASVAWVVRPKSQQDMSQGLRLTDLDDNERVLSDLVLLSDATELEQPVDVLWLTVKCTQLEQAVIDMVSWVTPSALIVCLQNGLGAEDKVKSAFPENPVLRGVMGSNIVEPQPGAVHRGSAGGLHLPDVDALKELRVLGSDLLPIEYYPDIEGLIWAKLQFNLNNALNALSDRTLYDELGELSYRKLLAAAMDELITVAKAKGIRLAKLSAIPGHWFPRLLSLPTFLFKPLLQPILAVDRQARSSMWEDIQAGRSSEIDYLNQALVAEGAELGISCPVNSQLTKCIKAVQQNELEVGLTAEQIMQY